MAIGIGRRQFISALGGAAVAWPLVAGAQQSIPVVGFLNTGSAEAYARRLAAFRQGLREAGYIEGHNVELELRWAEGQFDRLPALAVGLVRQKVDVIATSGGNPSAIAAREATTTIPIIFVSGGDPVGLGLVANWNRPGGNITGVSTLSTELGAKRLGLIRELVPGLTTVAVLVNPNNKLAEAATKDAQEAANTIGQRLLVLRARTDREIDEAFATLTEQRAGALLVTPDGLFSSRREQLIALATRHAVPTMYGGREDVAAGGLISYETSFDDAYRQAGIYVGKVLKGDKPGDLPIIQPTRFELVINLKTAKALGLTVSPKLLTTADEVIE